VTTNAIPARPARSRARAAAPAFAWRLLWIEIKRNVVPFGLPLLALLFFLDTYRTANGQPPVWTIRASAVADRLVVDFAPFAAGLAAWMGSREGRRKTGELLAPTARQAVERHLATLSATLLWVLLPFAACVAVLYVQTARVVTWGGPPLWPALVGVVAMVTLCTLGFTSGVLFPGRFTAPLAAIAGGVLPLIGSHNLVEPKDPHYLLGLGIGLPPYDLGVFHRVLPDVSIAQVMMMGGILLVALGLLALAPVLRAAADGFRSPFASLRAAVGGTGRWLCALSAVAVLAGLAASVTAYQLAGTAKPTAVGWNIAALHDSANDRPVQYTPDCTGTTFQVCVHPAFSGYLNGVAAALGPVAAEVAGLPGAPVRAAQIANPLAAPFGLSGSGTSRYYPFTAGIDWTSPAVTSWPQWRAGLQADFLGSVVGGARWWQAGSLGPAQLAVVNALMAGVGSESQAALTGYPLPPQVNATAKRFAALSPSVRHAWLAAHLTALQAGQITLREIP
jgi:hypothetical protein